MGWQTCVHNRVRTDRVVPPLTDVSLGPCGDTTDLAQCSDQ